MHKFVFAKMRSRSVIAGVRTATALLGLACCLAAAGCLLPPDDVELAAGAVSALPAGHVWLSKDAEGVLAYRLPEDREDAGAWIDPSPALPEWYSQCGVYEIDASGMGVLTTPAEDLDEVLNIWDVAPPPPEEEG